MIDNSGPWLLGRDAQLGVAASRPTIKCSAAGGRAESAHERWRARVLRGHRAVAELGS
jgi:hypothetical protein